MSREQVTSGIVSGPSVDEVYESALMEHVEYTGMDQSLLHHVITGALERIRELESTATGQPKITPEAAENVGTLWVLSGVGSYDEPIKADDNPKLAAMPWMRGFDRARLSMAAYLARKIAEVRSGQSFDSGASSSIAVRKAQTRELIAEYGPDIVYNGYRSENDAVARLLERPEIIIPRERVKLIYGKDMRGTTDQFRTFEYPDTPQAAEKEVAIISHAPHLGARVLHFAAHYDTFREGSVPYLVPIASPPEGRAEYALMETRGLLYYVFLRGEAAVEPIPSQLLG